ncbi:MAG: hypothetical protein ACOYMN_10495 [Roseimicrobium sp.]
MVFAFWFSVRAQLPPARPVAKLETYLLVPEPRTMGTACSLVLGGARKTVFSPATQTSEKKGLHIYTASQFAKLGISPETFAKRAKEAADRLLAAHPPELIKDPAGRVLYAVIRGEQPIFACLLVAPSLGKVFEPIFGKEVWVAAPDRHSLYVFPADAGVVDDFAGDLEERFESDAYAASEEVFVIRHETGKLQAVATFTER